MVSGWVHAGNGAYQGTDVPYLLMIGVEAGYPPITIRFVFNEVDFDTQGLFEKRFECPLI